MPMSKKEVKEFTKGFLTPSTEPFKPFDGSIPDHEKITIRSIKTSDFEEALQEYALQEYALKDNQPGDNANG